MATVLSSPVNERLAATGKQHCTPAGPTHTACSHKVMVSWTSTEHDGRRCCFSCGSGGLVHARHGAFHT
eukprot:scaffold34110_cov74-Phaeocystis_antarctica.AAC.9